MLGAAPNLRNEQEEKRLTSGLLTASELCIESRMKIGNAKGSLYNSTGYLDELRSGH